MLKHIWIVFVLSLLPSFLFSQEPGEQDDTIYIIRRIDCHITGKTKPEALRRVMGFTEGLEFSGRAALDVYIELKHQELYNLRVFEEGSAVAYTLGEPEPDGTVPVYLGVSVRDSSSFIVLPEPSYDSNIGFTLSLKAREYNLLGTLTPLKFDLVWESDDKGRNAAGFLVDAALPLNAFGYDWKVRFFNEFKYYLTDDPVYNKSAVDISMELPWKKTLFTFGFEQGLILHEENDERDDINDGQYHDWYLYSYPYIDWKIPTTLEAGPFGGIVYNPVVYGDFKYQPGGDVGEYRRGPGAGFKHELGFSRIDWIGNFRQGLEAAVFNDNEYNFHRQDWANSAGLRVAGHYRVSRLFGISGRLSYTAWLGEPYKLAGDTIRGYRDDELYAWQRLSLNLDFPFRLIRFVPSEWKGNPKYRFFDFEQHWSFFTDILMLDAPNDRTVSPPYAFKPEDIITAMGLEVITFPLKWRSFYLRISAGWNIREWARTGKLPSGIYREIYIGLGHFY